MLLMNTCRALTKKQINLEDFHMFLTSFFSGCLPKSSTIHEIFEVITHHKLWDFWNYHPLEEIVKGFAAADPEITSWIDTYKQDLKSYKVTTKLIDHIASQPARYNQQYYQKLSIKLKMEFTHHTLDYIDDLWNDFAELYGLPPYVALLDCISEGCVSIVWLIPSHLAPQIRSTTPPNGDFYRKYEVTKVELGEECIYQEEKEHHKVCDAVGDLTSKLAFFFCQMCFIIHSFVRCMPDLASNTVQQYCAETISLNFDKCGTIMAAGIL